MPFTPLFNLLSQEGYITQSCITTGLTEIRSANLGNRGRYYTAFFQLAIGMERMAKLAIILDHMVSDQLRPPGGKVIRDYGHDVSKLYAHTEAIAAVRGIPIESPVSPFKDRILGFVSSFASGARYANLDALASGARGPEPLEEWARILEEIAQADISERKREQIEGQSAALAHLLSNTALVYAHDLASQPMTLEDWFSNPRLLDEASRHAVWHLVLILDPLKQVIEFLSDAAMMVNRQKSTSIVDIPDLGEFYTFLYVDRKFVLGKKRWP